MTARALMPLPKQKSLTTYLLIYRQASLFDRNHFRDDNTKVSFYTTYELVEATFSHVSPFADVKIRIFYLYQEMSMVLKKLRLMFHTKILHIDLECPSQHCQGHLHMWLSPLIRWPERQELWRTMLQCFKFSFGTKTTAIIDCFEMFCVKPTNLLSRAQTFRSYKHHDTAKVITGITP